MWYYAGRQKLGITVINILREIREDSQSKKQNKPDLEDAKGGGEERLKNRKRLLKIKKRITFKEIIEGVDDKTEELSPK